MYDARPTPHASRTRSGTRIAALGQLLVSCALPLACRGNPYWGSGEQPPSERSRGMTREAFAREAMTATRRKALIKGWVDSQPLAELIRDSLPVGNTAARGTEGLRYGPGAKIVPIDYLERLDDPAFDRWQTVAYIYVERAYPKLEIPAPPRLGDPVALEIRRTSGDPVRGWEAHIIYPPTGYVSRVLRVRREVHPHADGPIPGSARWIFARDDEQAWIECGWGCCTVGAAQAQ